MRRRPASVDLWFSPASVRYQPSALTPLPKLVSRRKAGWKVRWLRRLGDLSHSGVGARSASPALCPCSERVPS